MIQMKINSAKAGWVYSWTRSHDKVVPN